MKIIRRVLFIWIVACAVHAQLHQPQPIRDNDPATLDRADREVYRRVLKHRWDVLRFNPRSAAPDNPEEGTLYYNGTMHVFYYWNGSAWVQV